VRNPFTRVLSEFYCEFGGPRADISRSCGTKEGFNAWISQQLHSILSAMTTPSTIMHGHWCPQHLYLTDAGGQRIILPDNILRFEKLDSDFEALMTRYRCPFTLKGAKKMLTSVNTTRPAEATSGGAVKTKFTVADLSAECVDLIRVVYKEDFTHFGYDLDPLRCHEVPPRPSEDCGDESAVLGKRKTLEAVDVKCEN
jgi:hypothetical protein